MNEKPKSKVKTIILVALVVVVIIAALVYSNQKPNVNYDSASMSARILEIQKELSAIQKELQLIQNDLAKTYDHLPEGSNNSESASQSNNDESK